MTRHRWPASVPLEHRVWASVERTPVGCWEFSGLKDHKGYGVLRYKGSLKRAHRVAWESAHGEELGSRFSLHRCDNPPCCNPMHLYAGTEADNAEDRTQRGQAKGNTTGGEEHYRTVLTVERVARMRQLRSEGMLLRELADLFDMSIPGVCAITTGRTWKNDYLNGREA